MSDNQLLNVLTREGVLIKVSVSFRRGCKKLKPEDIGLKAGDLSDRLIATIEASFPPAPQLERSFGFEIQLFQIAVPERLGLDMITVGDQQNLVTARQQAAQEAHWTIRLGVHCRCR
jgi:hypothetical protein